MRTLGALALVLTLAGCGGDSKAGEPETAPPIEAAGAKCQESIGRVLRAASMDDSASPSDFLQVGDKGHSATISNAPDGGSISAIYTVQAIECMLKELDAPDSLDSQLGQTTAMMGRQEESWGTFTLEWSYHPDSGVSAVLTES
jgi:hypothetical protein